MTELPAVAPEGLLVPSSAKLGEALSRATTLAELMDFDAMMSVLEEAATRFKIAIDEAIRVAVFHLEGKRKLGLDLAQWHAHG